MRSNINTIPYWDQRFSSGNWEECGGRSQTAAYAEECVQLLRLPATFSGSILDFGCGLGDAFPIYRLGFPMSNLIGVDHSEAAISQCNAKYGHIATFIHGDDSTVPKADVIIASHVLEHITDDEAVVRSLLSKCSDLYIFVPYMETPLCTEHVNYYDNTTYSSFDRREAISFHSRGWSQYGWDLLVDVYLKNLLRPFLGMSLTHRRKQIMYRITGFLDN